MTLADIFAIYQASSGEATKALYATLEHRGPAGTIAVNLLRACKASERAKVYRGRRFKTSAYDKKEWSLGNLCGALEAHARDLRIIWGWGGVLKLNNGKWLGHPRHGFATYNEQFDSRSAALRASIAHVVWNMRYHLYNRDRWRCGDVPAWRASAIIGWARRLAPPRPFVGLLWSTA